MGGCAGTLGYHCPAAIHDPDRGGPSAAGEGKKQVFTGMRVMRDGPLRRVLLLWIIVLLATPGVPAATVSGRVFGPAGVTPVSDARVVFYNLQTGVSTRSEPTSLAGEYRLVGLKGGPFHVAAVADDGLWPVEQTVELGRREIRTISFALREKTYWQGAWRQPALTSPLGNKIIGPAVILEQETTAPERSRRKRRRKVALGVAIGGLILGLALAAGDDSDGGAGGPTP